MSAPFRIGVGGIPELRRDLRAIAPSLPRRVIPRANRRAAELVEPVARRESPVLSGRTQRTHRVLASQSRGAVAAGSAAVYWSRMVFFGTGQRRRRSGGRTGAVAANRWLERALAAVGDRRIVEVYQRELESELRKVGLGSS